MTNQFTELEMIADEELLATSGGIAFVPAAIGIGKFIGLAMKPAAVAVAYKGTNQAIGTGVGEVINLIKGDG